MIHNVCKCRIKLISQPSSCSSADLAINSYNMDDEHTTMLQRVNNTPQIVTQFTATCASKFALQNVILHNKSAFPMQKCKSSHNMHDEHSML